MKSRRNEEVEVKHSAPIPIPQQEHSPTTDYFTFYVGSPRSERVDFLNHGFPPDRTSDYTNLMTRREFERRRNLIEKHLFWTASKSPAADAVPAQEPPLPEREDEAVSQKSNALRQRI